MSVYSSTGTPKRVTASGAVATDMGSIIGVLCSASTAGTILLSDAANATDAAIAANQFTAAITLVTGGYTPIPAAFAKGLYVTVGGTLDATFFVC